MISATVRQIVRQRAADRCEYCRIPQHSVKLSHQVEHIIAKLHGGSDELDNLALACMRCNLHKGPNISGLDPWDQTLVGLFHPRHDVWRRDFEFHEALIVGLTPVGRTTVVVLAMNEPRRLNRRAELIAEGEVL